MKSADRYFGLEAYQITEIGFDKTRCLESESVFSLANEHMGMRGFFEEGGGFASLRGCYLGGVYEAASHKPESNYRGFVRRTHFMVTAADMLHTALRVAGETLDLSACAFHAFRRTLDMQSGLLTRSFVWETKAAGRVEVCFERLVSMTRPELAAQRITLCALDGDAAAELCMGVNGNVIHQATGQCQWKDLGGDELLLQTETTGISVRYALDTDCPGTERRERGPRALGSSFSFTLQKGVPALARRQVAAQVFRGANPPALPDMPGFARLLEENREHWRVFWQRNDVEIAGDRENQQGVRYCLFQLHSAYRGLRPTDNIGAKGLTGEAYNGHAFWDTETYCLPFYLFSDPKAAKALLLYRYHTLPKAMERARELDLHGACYPIATLDGTEACTLWQHSSLQPQPTTAVAYAVETYCEMTGDEEFLGREGAEMLCQIARYLISRGGWNEAGFGFYGVMGPDEFHMMVSNDFYTNFMGKKALSYAARVLKARPRAAARLGVDREEWEAWENAAEHMLLPRRADGVFEQHEGYFSLPHTDVAAIPREEFPLYEHWSYDRIYRTDMLKQPDVLMAMYLYPGDFTREEKERNYAFYEPRCIHESSLSPSVHSILAGELGRRREALAFFGFATRLDLDNYNRNTREGLHLSSMAAAWVTIVEGFGGVRVEEGRVSLAPWLPDGWEEFSFSLEIRGALLRARVEKDGVTLTSDRPVMVEVYGRAVKAEARAVKYARS